MCYSIVKLDDYNASAEHIVQTPEPFKLNFYADYKNAYDAAIDALNTDYPDGK